MNNVEKQQFIAKMRSDVEKQERQWEELLQYIKDNPGGLYCVDEEDSIKRNEDNPFWSEYDCFCKQQLAKMEQN